MVHHRRLSTQRANRAFIRASISRPRGALSEFPTAPLGLHGAGVDRMSRRRYQVLHYSIHLPRTARLTETASRKKPPHQAQFEYGVSLTPCPQAKPRWRVRARHGCESRPDPALAHRVLAPRAATQIMASMRGRARLRHGPRIKKGWGQVSPFTPSANSTRRPNRRSFVSRQAPAWTRRLMLP